MRVSRRTFLASLSLVPAVAKAIPVVAKRAASVSMNEALRIEAQRRKSMALAQLTYMQMCMERPPRSYVNHDVLFNEPMSIHEALREFGA